MCGLQCIYKYKNQYGEEVETEGQEMVIKTDNVEMETFTFDEGDYLKGI